MVAVSSLKFWRRADFCDIFPCFWFAAGHEELIFPQHNFTGLFRHAVVTRSTNLWSCFPAAPACLATQNTLDWQCCQTNHSLACSHRQNIMFVITEKHDMWLQWPQSVQVGLLGVFAEVMHANGLHSHAIDCVLNTGFFLPMILNILTKL